MQPSKVCSPGLGIITPLNVWELDLGQVKLKYSEMVTSMTSYAHDGTSCVLVGTGILSSGENEPQAGRIIVFKADSETGMFKLEGSKEVRFCPLKLSFLWTSGTQPPGAVGVVGDAVLGMGYSSVIAEETRRCCSSTRER